MFVLVSVSALKNLHQLTWNFTENLCATTAGTSLTGALPADIKVVGRSAPHAPSFCDGGRRKGQEGRDRQYKPDQRIGFKQCFTLAA